MVAAATLDGVRQGRFLVMPHPHTAEYVVRRATDHERWLAGMANLGLPGGLRVTCWGELPAEGFPGDSGLHDLGGAVPNLQADTSARRWPSEPFISLEVISISSYVLAGFSFNKKSAEGSLVKYFLFGSVASAIMLYGFSILYGLTGTMDFRRRIDQRA